MSQAYRKLSSSTGWRRVPAVVIVVIRKLGLVKNEIRSSRLQKIVSACRTSTESSFTAVCNYRHVQLRPGTGHRQKNRRDRKISSKCLMQLKFRCLVQSKTHCYDVIVMVSPLRCSGVMLCSKCPLTIPGRRYRLPGGVMVSPLRSEGIPRASN